MARIATSVAAGILAVGIAFGAAPALAVDEPVNIIAYRQSTMQAMSAHMGAMASVVKGKISFSDQMVDHTIALQATARLVHRLFPKGSGPEAGKTAAKSEIWTDWARLEAAAKTLQAATSVLVEAAKSGDEGTFKKAFGATGKACGGCHKPFRVPTP